MAETVLVLMESGQPMPHDLPLPEGLAQRVATGEAKVLGPCDDKGELLAPVRPEPVEMAPGEPVAEPAAEPEPVDPHPVEADEPVAEPEPVKAEESPAKPVKRVPRQRTAHQED